MGVSQRGTADAVLSEEELEAYKMLTLFEEEEIIALRLRFLPFAAADDTITREEAVAVIGLALHPLKERMVDLFGGVVRLDFAALLREFSVLSRHATVEEKTRYAFQLWDWDRDGVLNERDVRHTIDVVAAATLSNDDRAAVVRSMFAEHSVAEQDGISFEAFQRVVVDTDIRRKLTLQL
eukprot:gene7296-11259_t